MRLGGFVRACHLGQAHTIRIYSHGETLNKLDFVSNAISCKGQDKIRRQNNRWTHGYDAPGKVREILKIAQGPVSLETPIGGKKTIAIWEISIRQSD